MREAEKALNDIGGHKVLMPIKAKGVDYWSDDNRGRVEAKKKYGFISEHIEKIDRSDAILVVNITKNNIKNYIGANTFLEIGFAHYKKKKIFFLTPPQINHILPMRLKRLNRKLSTGIIPG